MVLIHVWLGPVFAGVVTPKMFQHAIKTKCLAAPQKIVLPEVGVYRGWGVDAVCVVGAWAGGWVGGWVGGLGVGGGLGGRVHACVISGGAEGCR
jgi:hypothetical protein